MTKQETATTSKIRMRIAALALFVAQGVVFASWASRLPDIKADFNVADLLQFSIVLFLIPIGKFVAIPLVSFLFPRIGSKKTVLISILGFTLSLFVIGFISSDVYSLGVVMFFFGMFWNMTDISLNTQAIEVEKLYGSPIIATFHASWSLAACIGALIGYFMINLGINPRMHFVIITILAVLLIISNYKFLPEVQQNNSLAKDTKKEIGLWDLIKKRQVPEVLLIYLGLIWLSALIVENTMFDWSDIYFNSVIKAPESLQIGFLVFMTMMFIGRMITNVLYSYWTKINVLKVAGIFIFSGFVISSLGIDMAEEMIFKVIISSTGFMLIGLGISCVVPTLYSIVAEKSSTPPGLALTIMSSISFAGPLISPLMVGYISHNFKLEWAYFAVGIVGGLCIFLITFFSKTLRK